MTDWTHVWRSIRRNLNKLKDSTLIGQVWEDISFFHEDFDVDLHEHSKRMLL